MDDAASHSDEAGGVFPRVVVGPARSDGRRRRRPRAALMAAPEAGGSGSGPVLDEFTAPAEKSGFLERSRGRIASLFGARLAVLGAPDGWSPAGPSGPCPRSDRIWLQLAGGRRAVLSAKVTARGWGRRCSRGEVLPSGGRAGR